MTDTPTKRVHVVDYDDDWPAAFEREAARLRTLLPAPDVSIHHIGSTSVRGLCAKPVIDVLIGVVDLATVDAAVEDLRAQGYQPKGEHGIRGRRYFSKAATPRQLKVHVHAFLRTSHEVTRHLAFRDHLRAHTEVAAQYGELKRRLAAEHPEDAEAYQAGKADFIAAVLDVAARDVIQSANPLSAIEIPTKTREDLP